MIFDQFEELYSKPELFGIFKSAKDLMLDVTASQSNLILGFAWKTDSTTQQDHPAYHLWHELADHRREYRLDVFEKGEISQSITRFEKEINHKISAEIRHQVTEVSQGFPWLLKKLCINLYEGIVKGEDADFLSVDLDIERLFQADLSALNLAESNSLKLIAQKAPADWSEIIEISGITVLNHLVNKRLVIKSGDRLNIYWDIFKDYLLTGKVPVVPYNYIPTTNLSSLCRVCTKLDTSNFIDSQELAKLVNLNEKTIWNIGADLVMLGLADRKGNSFKISDKLGSNEERSILLLLRSQMDKHSLKVDLFKKYSGKTINNNIVHEVFKDCMPKAKFVEKTWRLYSNRMINYLVYTGFLLRAGYGLIVQDATNVILDKKGLSRRASQRSTVFSAFVSPLAVLEALNEIPHVGCHQGQVKRNELYVLKRFELVVIHEGKISLNDDLISKSGGGKEAIWFAAKNERSLLRCIELMNEYKGISAKDLASKISEEFNLSWSEGSKIRNGGILRQWSLWVQEGMELMNVPNPPGRANKNVM